MKRRFRLSNNEVKYLLPWSLIHCVRGGGVGSRIAGHSSKIINLEMNLQDCIEWQLFFIFMFSYIFISEAMEKNEIHILPCSWQYLDNCAFGTVFDSTWEQIYNRGKKFRWRKRIRFTFWNVILKETWNCEKKKSSNITGTLMANLWLQNTQRTLGSIWDILELEKTLI